MIQVAPTVVDHRPRGEQQVHPNQNVLSPHDERLCERVRRALQTPGYHQLRHIQVSAQDGTVILRGRVESYYLKQVAQAQVLAMQDVKSVQNKLVVGCPAR